MNTWKLWILVALVLPGSFLLGQKEDNTWVLGYSFEDQQPVRRPLGGTDLIFNETGSVDTLYVPRKTFFDAANASICDPLGSILFYTNGEYVYTRLHTDMRGGDIIGQGGGLGNPLRQGYMILPFPKHEHQYYIIYGQWEIRNRMFGVMFNFQFSLVDLSLDNGLGRVVQRNVLVSENDFSLGNITACRHANGRDWWIAIPGYRNHSIELFLLDPLGLRPYSQQHFLDRDLNIGGAGSAVFSPNGTTYIYAEGFDVYQDKYIHVFDFDRCTGEFSLVETIIEPESSYAFSAVISPDSRMIYNILDTSIYQYRLDTTDITAGKLLVAEYDGFVDWVNTEFDRAALGPNGKVYVNSVSSSFYLTVIEEPNVRGMGCDIRQHSLRMPSYNFRTMPNFPNFRLGKLEGSPCDSLISSTANRWEDSRFKVYPNPSSGPISIELDLPEWSRDDISIGLYDVTGKEVYRYRFAQWAYIHTMDPGTLPAGVYLVRLEIDGAVVHTERVVVD